MVREQEFITLTRFTNKGIQSQNMDQGTKGFRQRLNIARSNAKFVDVCLRVDGSGKIFKAHQVVLAAASDILKIEDLFEIKGVSEEDLEDILTYIYVGRVQVPHARLQSFLKASKTLRVFDLQTLVHDGEGSKTAVTIKEESMEFKTERREDDTFDPDIYNSFEGNVDLPNQLIEAQMSRPEKFTDSPKKMSEVVPYGSYDLSVVQPESNVQRSDKNSRDPNKDGISRKEASPAGKGKGHNKNCTKKKTFNCATCKMAFCRKVDRKIHERIHTGEKPISCVTCKKAFRDKNALKDHKRIHTGDKKNHKRIPTDEKPFSCTTCKKAFKKKAHLKYHETTHTGETLFSCATCKKAFKQIAKLKIHERIHNAERPFPCGTCQKAFYRKGALKDHERIHTEGKPFSCSTCKKAFKRQRDLKQHQKIHTG